MPNFITCPGCGQQNLEDQGETQVHSKNCSIGLSGVVQAQDAPVKSRSPEVLTVILGFILVGFVGFTVGHEVGEDHGRKAEEGNTVFYQKSLNSCQERDKTTLDLYEKEADRNLKLWKLLNFMADASSLSQADRDKILRKTVELGLDK